MTYPHIDADPAQARRSRKTAEALQAIVIISHVAWEYDYLDEINEMLGKITAIVEANADE